MTDWRATPTLAGKHVTLLPLVIEDRSALLEVFSALGDLFFTFVPGETTIDAWFAKAFEERDVGRAMPFAVLSADGRIAGTTRFMRMSEVDRRVEIGGTLYAPRVQRTALNSEAKLLLLGHAFEVLGCTCVQLRTDWLNLRSRRAIERLGAKRDGVLRGHRMMADGHLRDTVVYSIIAGEWPGVRAHLRHLLATGEGEAA